MVTTTELCLRMDTLGMKAGTLKSLKDSISNLLHQYNDEAARSMTQTQHNVVSIEFEEEQFEEIINELYEGKDVEEDSKENNIMVKNSKPLIEEIQELIMLEHVNVHF